MKTVKSIISFVIIIMVSLLICTLVGLVVLYITENARAFFSIILFGSMFVALTLGAFDA